MKKLILFVVIAVIVFFLDMKKDTKSVMFSGILGTIFLIYYYILHLESREVGPVTFTPIIPFPQEKLKELKDSSRVSIFVPEARILCGESVETRERYYDKTYYANKEMNRWMRWMFDLKSIVGNEELYRGKPKNSVPDDARIISIKMEGFKHGRFCHDFVPIFGMTPGSYFTYQIFGKDRIQVTTYVENGVEYVAGFCIYVSNPWLYGVRFRKSVVQKCLKSRKYPGRQSEGLVNFLNVVLQDENSRIQVQRTTVESSRTEAEPTSPEALSDPLFDSLHLESTDPKWEVLYCPRLGRMIMSAMDSGAGMIHQEWNPVKKEMKMVSCSVCSEMDDQPPPYSSLGLSEE